MNLDFTMKVLADLKTPSRTIQMVDLRAQYDAIANDVDAAFREIITTAAFINGPYVQNFQADLEEYLDVKHVIPCGNGTDALQIALMALGLKPGDEVIAPAFTFLASVEVIAVLGLTPVIVDVDERTFNMDIGQLEAAVGPNTKAIMPVHLFGQCADMDALQSFAQKHNLFIIEDNAQSVGAEYVDNSGVRRKSGCMGDFGCLSFYPSKNLGAYGDGGAIMTNNAKLAELARSVSNHGMSKKRYCHDRVGINSRLDSLQAAVLSIKLRHLDEYAQARQQAAAFYDTHLGAIEGVRIPVRSAQSTHIFHQYTIQVSAEQRDALKAHLSDLGIPSMIYYPVPVQDQEAFASLIRTPVSLDTTVKLSGTVLSLPMHTELDEEQLGYICTAIRLFFRESVSRRH
jgi:UDP-2-acetamido-2-deoxy-ribo-hexuluronate aminotransferase